MKCHLCPNYIEIKTEPKTSEYIIVSGARRQENRWDPKENEQLVPEDKSTSKRLFDDAMFKLEHGCGDKKQADSVQPALAKLTAKRQKLWQDDYAANCILRQQFREKNNELKSKDAKDAALLQKSSLQIKLLPLSKEDKLKAAQLYESATQYYRAKKTTSKQKEFSNMSLSCFDECSRGADMDKEESNLTRFIILNSVRQKSLDDKVSECEDTSCILDDRHSSTLPSKMDEGITADDAIVGSSECSKSISKNSELGSRTVHASDCSVNTDSAAHPKMSINALISTERSLDSHIINSETDIPVRNVSLVSDDYNFSSSDESSS